jgi:HSP20 family protein
LKNITAFADVWHAAIMVKAAQCTGWLGTITVVLIPFHAKELIMFFAPVVHTRAAFPAFRSFDRSFERFVNEAFFGDASRGLKVEQDDKAWTVSLDLPGVSREDLTIAIEGSVVRIETKAQAKRQFKAAYELPQDIAADSSTAKLENGVLTLTLAKDVPASKVRQIEIK